MAVADRFQVSPTAFNRPCQEQALREFTRDAPAGLQARERPARNLSRRFAPARRLPRGACGSPKRPRAAAVGTGGGSSSGLRILTVVVRLATPGSG